MPRPLRIEFPGAIYHLMNRGDRSEPIFRDDLGRHEQARERRGTDERLAERLISRGDAESAEETRGSFFPHPSQSPPRLRASA